MQSMHWNAMPCNMQKDALPCNALECNAVQYAVQLNAMQCNVCKCVRVYVTPYDLLCCGVM